MISSGGGAEVLGSAGILYERGVSERGKSRCCGLLGGLIRRRLPWGDAFKRSFIIARLYVGRHSSKLDVFGTVGKRGFKF